MSVLKLAPNFAQKSEVLFKLAVIFGKTYQLDQSINYFKLASLENTGNPAATRRIEILIKMGICYLEKKEYVDALRSYEAAMSMNDQNVFAVQHVAWCEFLMEKYGPALEHIEKAITMKESDSDGYYIKSRILMVTEKYSEAKESLNKALFYNQTKAIYLTSLGIVNCLSKCDTDAFDNFLKATQLDPNIPEIWYNIGLLYEVHLQYNEAAVAYQKAIDVSIDFTLATTRKEAITKSTETKPSLPPFVHPSFHVYDTMVPLKSFLNNQKIKKALESNYTSSGQNSNPFKNIFSDPIPASMPPPEDGVVLSPPISKPPEEKKEIKTKPQPEKKEIKVPRPEPVVSKPKEEYKPEPKPVQQEEVKAKIPEQPKAEHQNFQLNQPYNMPPSGLQQMIHPQPQTSVQQTMPHQNVQALNIPPIPISGSQPPNMTQNFPMPNTQTGISMNNGPLNLQPGMPQTLMGTSMPLELQQSHPQVPVNDMQAFMQKFMRAPQAPMPAPNQCDMTSRSQYAMPGQSMPSMMSIPQMQQFQQMSHLAQMPQLSQTQQATPTPGQQIPSMMPGGFNPNPQGTQMQPQYSFMGQLPYQALLGAYGLMSQPSGNFLRRAEDTEKTGFLATTWKTWQTSKPLPIR